LNSLRVQPTADIENRAVLGVCTTVRHPAQLVRCAIGRAEFAPESHRQVSDFEEGVDDYIVTTD
jgi:hypothetical protein